MYGQNTIIQNLGSTTLYASASPNISPDADGAAAIPPGGGLILHDTRGTIYLLTGTDYGAVNFKQPPLSGNGSGGEILKPVVELLFDGNLFNTGTGEYPVEADGEVIYGEGENGGQSFAAKNQTCIRACLVSQRMQITP